MCSMVWYYATQAATGTLKHYLWFLWTSSKANETLSALSNPVLPPLALLLPPPFSENQEEAAGHYNPL